METPERQALHGILDLIKDLVIIGDAILAGNIGEASFLADGLDNDALNVKSAVRVAYQKSRERG